MKLEHVAFNVAEPHAVAAWYGAQLGLRVARDAGDPNQTVFLATSDGAVLLEFYRHSTTPVPDYARKSPAELHLAFAADEVDATAARLIAAGATLATPAVTTPAGDRLVMLRDPFGLALQLVKRRTPFPGLR